MMMDAVGGYQPQHIWRLCRIGIVRILQGGCIDIFYCLHAVVGVQDLPFYSIFISHYPRFMLTGPITPRPRILMSERIKHQMIHISART